MEKCFSYTGTGNDDFGGHCYDCGGSGTVPIPAKRVWALGASDPEMDAIEALLRTAGERVTFVLVGGKRCHPGNAYRAEDVTGVAWGAVTHLVECGGIPEACIRDSVVRIDHHMVGDLGFGEPPSEYLAASSIGQVISKLAKLGKIPTEWTRDFAGGSVWPGDFHEGSVATDEAGPYDSPWAEIPAYLQIIAAADHCLGAAYRGECPGVTPKELAAWRVASRAAFQKRSVEAVKADIENAKEMLYSVPHIVGEPAYSQCTFWCAPCNTVDNPDCKAPPAWSVADMRAAGFVAELPEAAAQAGLPFVAEIKDRDGRRKVVLQAADPACVRAFLAGKVVPGLTDTYGDPARGFAGGYLGGKTCES